MSTATPTGMAFGYARVSTTQQEEDHLRDALEAGRSRPDLPGRGLRSHPVARPWPC